MEKETFRLVVLPCFDLCIGLRVSMYMYMYVHIMYIHVCMYMYIQYVFAYCIDSKLTLITLTWYIQCMHILVVHDVPWCRHSLARQCCTDSARCAG